MASLLDVINSRQQSRLVGAAGSSGPQSAMQQVADLARTATGKQIGAGEIAISNVGEQSARLAQRSAAETTLAPALEQERATQRLASREMDIQERQVQTSAVNARRFDDLKFRQQADNVMRELYEGRAAISQDSRNASLNEAAFLVSMQNKHYTTALADVGRRRRLEDEANFNDEMLSVVFGDSLAVLEQALQGQSLLNASERTYQAALANMSISDAYKVAQIEMQSMRDEAALKQRQIRVGANAEITSANIVGRYQALNSALQGGITYATNRRQDERQDALIAAQTASRGTNGY